MLVRFVKPFAHYQPGQTINPPAGQAELMIQRGWCVKADEEKPKDQKQQKNKPKQ